MDRPLHPDDIVVSKTNDRRFAVVERTHADIDTHDPRPGRAEADPIKHAKDINHADFKKFMKEGVPPKGTVLVRWDHMPNAELISESKVTLLDRSLLIGDVVKKNAQDAMSGVVLNTFTACTLQPMCDVKYRGSGPLKALLPRTTQLSPGIKLADSPPPLIDIPASELMYAESPTEEDLVIFKDWIGRVAAVAYNITIKLLDGTVVEIRDELAEHADGAVDTFNAGDIAVTKKGHLRTGKWVFGQYSPNTHPVGTVVQTTATAAEVSWLHRRFGSVSQTEPPNPLEREELESASYKIYDRTRRPPKQIPAGACGQTEATSNSEIDVRLQLRVRFKDISGACVKYDGSTSQGILSKLDRKDTLGYDLNLFDVASFRTDVTVQWQDLSITRENSIDLVPDGAIDDEHAAWPGEIVHTLDVAQVPGIMRGVESPSKVGVVQSINAAERMTKVVWCPDAMVEYSVDPDEESGLKPLVTGHVGAATGEPEEISLYDVEAPAAMNVRRGDIVLIANTTWTTGTEPPRAADQEWLGEIVDTCLDGMLIVRLGAADIVRDVKLRREDVIVAIRSDGTEEVEEWEENEFDDELMDDGELVYHPELDRSGHVGGWHEQANRDPNGDVGWDDDYDYASDEEDEEEDEEPQVRYENENGEPMDEDEVENEEWESDDGKGDATMQDADAQPTPLTPQLAPTEEPPAYLVLEGSVPTSHHYASERPTEANAHMKRVQKEHRILQKPSAIPPGVYVRTWESRLDLIRALFIGPSDTPYADAPFIVDFYLPPQFPTEPPHAFFHSWPGESGMGGVGRVNPNLYEDGKICLSLLGTWEGNKGEGWNAARSTLLQVIVSLLGLVLVKEPYFNEAGYEHLVGLEASKRPSALCNERTYLRARGFVITAVSRLAPGDEGRAAGLECLEDVTRWLYTSADGPRLVDRIVHDLEMVLERSDKGGQESDGLTVVSKGACVPLRRALERLKQLQH